MENLLPYDGVVFYYGSILTAAEATRLFTALHNNISWQHDAIRMYGRLVTTKRKVAWYGNEEYAYTYSGITKKAMLWTPELMYLKQKLEQNTGDTFNSCLLNLYHNGQEGMGWHSDDESTLQKDAPIASLSFGAERTFSFRHKKTKEVVSLLLEEGSLLLMKGTTQQYWHHSLPKVKGEAKERINLTFRTMAVQ